VIRRRRNEPRIGGPLPYDRAPRGWSASRCVNELTAADHEPARTRPRSVNDTRRHRVYRVHVASGAIPRLDDIDLSEHAVEQYRERVKPALDSAAARVELGRLVFSGEILMEPPAWSRMAGTKPYYLVIADALALPLALQSGRWVTTTCLVKTTLTERRREERSQHKARRASAKRARRQARW
jgi:hypothetical protein